MVYFISRKGENCVSASGQALPPFMIYPSKRMPQHLQEGCVPGTVFTCSGNGWVTQELYLQWFKFLLLVFRLQGQFY